MDPEGVVTLEMDERISMRKAKRQTFQLMIQQLKSTDSGRYLCSVQEWIQDPDGIWYSLDTKSVIMELDVFEKGIFQKTLHFYLITPQTTKPYAMHYTIEKPYKLMCQLVVRSCAGQWS